MTQRWTTHLVVLAGAMIAEVALLHNDLFDMARIWWDASTYNHCMFILPIIACLIWQRKDELAQLQPRSWWPGLIGIAIGSLGWVLGEAGGVGLFRHASLILILQSLVATTLGPVVVRGLLFPLFYLFFLVPFGEELVPQLQTVTAKMSMFFLGIVGIPAQIEGVFITTPVGMFEVAEACSGVKFLVAMAAYATLVSNVCFKSMKRRIPFLGMALVVPILANGFRAFSTIWISELTGSTAFAESFDHIIYGWVFFGVVMFLVMALGWRWFDRRADELWLLNLRDETPSTSTPFLKIFAALTLISGIIGAEHLLSTMGRHPMPAKVDLPEIAGWKRVPIAQHYPWRPRFDAADHLLWGEYENGAGQRIDLFVALYAWQEERRELVGYAQGAFDPRTRWSWANETSAPPNGRAERIFAPDTVREVASFYWTGGTLTGNAATVKMEALKARLLGQDQAAAAVLVSAEESSSKPSRAAIDAFLTSFGPVDHFAQSMIKKARGAD